MSHPIQPSAKQRLLPSVAAVAKTLLPSYARFGFDVVHGMARRASDYRKSLSDAMALSHAAQTDEVIGTMEDRYRLACLAFKGMGDAFGVENHDAVGAVARLTAFTGQTGRTPFTRGLHEVLLHGGSREWEGTVLLVRMLGSALQSRLPLHTHARLLTRPNPSGGMRGKILLVPTGREELTPHEIDDMHDIPDSVVAAYLLAARAGLTLPVSGALAGLPADPQDGDFALTVVDDLVYVVLPSDGVTPQS